MPDKQFAPGDRVRVKLTNDDPWTEGIIVVDDSGHVDVQSLGTWLFPHAELVARAHYAPPDKPNAVPIWVTREEAKTLDQAFGDDAMAQDTYRSFPLSPEERTIIKRWLSAAMKGEA